MLIGLVSTISNSVIFAEKNVRSFCKCKSYSHFFSKNTSKYAIFKVLTNDIVSFEQMGPDVRSTNCSATHAPIGCATL